MNFEPEQVAGALHQSWSRATARHFYNRIDGVRLDFTKSQFAHAITYTDVPTTRGDAERGATSTELAALRVAFLRHADTASDQGHGNYGDRSVGRNSAAYCADRQLKSAEYAIARRRRA